MSSPPVDPLTGPHLVAAISAMAEADPERKAVGFVRHPEHEGEEALRSYAWLDATARRVAVLLRTAGLGTGARVLLLFPQSEEFAAAYAGCLYAGMVAVPAPLPTGTSLEAARVVGIANDAEAGAVLTVSETEADVREWADRTGLGALPLFSVDELPGDADPDMWREPEIRADTVAVLQYTSGSTGSPKGVVVTHGALADNVRSLLTGFELGAGSRLGGWLPMYHDMGLFGLLSPALFSGGAAVLMSGSAFLRRPSLWLTLIDRFDLAFSAAPDFAYDYCVRRVKPEEMDRLDLSRWRRAANGSEPVRAETLRAFAKEFAPAGLHPHATTPCYGLAEATLLVSLSAGSCAPGGWTSRNWRTTASSRPPRDAPPARSSPAAGPRPWRSASSTPRPASPSPATGWARSECAARAPPGDTGRNPRRPPRRSSWTRTAPDPGCAPATSAPCTRASCTSLAASRNSSSCTAATSTPTTSSMNCALATPNSGRSGPPSPSPPRRARPWSSPTRWARPSGPSRAPSW
nr:AMP-binding protein [Streptomyces fulvorobeus]